LSPTLSAITAGFLGSSSGLPASTLPTKSAPTSAPFVTLLSTLISFLGQKPRLLEKNLEK
jgi:hypothetical protein